MDSITVSLASLGLIIICSIFSFWIVDYLLLKQLEKSDSGVYKELGKPQFFVHLSAKFTYWYSFILMGGYKRYSLSAKSVLLCQVNRALLLLLHAGLAMFLIQAGWH